jgi:hypothetical protein
VTLTSLAFLAFLGLAGCSMIDAVDNRAITVNDSVAEYYNEATLINILRAANGEPLIDVSLSQVQGHNTLTGTMAVPTVNYGPHQTPAQHIQAFGPNSLSRTASNDFTMNTVDDQSTYAALYSPVTPASVSLLIAQGYSREFIFKLLLDRMRIHVPQGGKMPNGTVVPEAEGRWVTLLNDPSFYDLYGENIVRSRRNIPTATQDVKDAFNIAIDQLVNEGLTLQYRQSSGLLTPDAHGNVRFCTDPEALGNIYPMERRTAFANVQTSLTNEQSSNGTLCDETAWDGDTTSTPSTASGQPASAGYALTLDNGTRVEFYFRSVYGTYVFISQFVPGSPRYSGSSERLYSPLFTSQYRDRLIADHANPADGEALFELHENDTHEGDFVQTAYAHKHWSVAADAHSTKMVFAVLHQLVQLYSTPNDARGNTGTVRAQ